MSISLVNEKGTCVATVNLIDETGKEASPITSQYKLLSPTETLIPWTDFTGNEIVLTGDQLSIGVDGSIDRTFAVQGTYNSDAGTGLNFTEEVDFQIRNLRSQT